MAILAKLFIQGDRNELSQTKIKLGLSINQHFLNLMQVTILRCVMGAKEPYSSSIFPSDLSEHLTIRHLSYAITSLSEHRGVRYVYRLEAGKRNGNDGPKF